MNQDTDLLMILEMYNTVSQQSKEGKTKKEKDRWVNHRKGRSRH